VHTYIICAFPGVWFAPTVKPVRAFWEADNSLDGVECTAYHSGSRGVADIMLLTMPLLSIKDLAVASFTRAGPAEDDPPLCRNMQ